MLCATTTKQTYSPCNFQLCYLNMLPKKQMWLTFSKYITVTSEILVITQPLMQPKDTWHAVTELHFPYLKFKALTGIHLCMYQTINFSRLLFYFTIKKFSITKDETNTMAPEYIWQHLVPRLECIPPKLFLSFLYILEKRPKLLICQ